MLFLLLSRHDPNILLYFRQSILKQQLQWLISLGKLAFESLHDVGEYLSEKLSIQAIKSLFDCLDWSHKVTQDAIQGILNILDTLVSFAQDFVLV